MTFYGLTGSMMAWDARLVLCNAANGGSVTGHKREAGGFPRVWQYVCPAGRQVTSLVLCSNAAVIGGGVYPPDSTEQRGFVAVLSRDQGTPISEFELGSAPVYDGMAVAGGSVYATLSDGSVVCLGDRR
jgi:hypothetical protein